MAGRPGTRVEVHYQETDGEPIGETETHVLELMRLLQTLREAFAAAPQVYVGGALLVYYIEGNPRRFVVPDIFVVVGASKLPPRRIYKLWGEGVPPAFVLEVTSPSTRRTDQVEKRALYADLGVAEYVLYDPLAEYLRPALQGYRLQAGAYRAMPVDDDGALLSDALAIRLALEDGRLRLYDRRTGLLLLSPSERIAAAEARITAAETRTAAAEARIAELERLLRERDRP